MSTNAIKVEVSIEHPLWKTCDQYNRHLLRCLFNRKFNHVVLDEKQWRLGQIMDQDPENVN
jgi:hypothetical protein